MPITSRTAHVSEAAGPRGVLYQNSATAPNRVPMHDRGVSDALYTAAHKALRSLAFALQEVSTKQNEKENNHASGESGQA
jgi:hypothetical protein